jgi:hypothetical protein
MAEALTARDLWPLVLKLNREERVSLAKLALRAAGDEVGEVSAYRSSPPREEEFGSTDDALAWEGEGWEEFSAPR